MSTKINEERSDNATKLRICVYAITKDEDELLKRAISSAIDADLIIIGDTGGSNTTRRLVKDKGAVYHRINVNPWRFDDARNALLSLVPLDVDVCVSLDSDEVLADGWRKEIEDQWKSDTTIMRYMYDWNSGVTFHQAKIHARKGYRWVSPCHETLTYYGSGKETWAYTDKFMMYHYPDNTKSRGSYLPLLRMGYKEAPHIPRNVLYYGREVFFAWLNCRHLPEMKDKTEEFRKHATDVLYQFINMPGKIYPAEVMYAYRILGKMNDDTEAFSLALDENKKLQVPHRCPYIWYGAYLYSAKQFELARRAIEDGLKITDRTTDYMVDPHSWDGYPLHLLSWCYHHLGDKAKSIDLATQAVEMEPENEYYKKCLEKFTNEE